MAVATVLARPSSIGIGGADSGGRDRFGAALHYRLPQSRYAGIGMNFQEEPAWLDQHGLHFGDLEFVADTDGRPGILATSLPFVFLQLLEIIGPSVIRNRRLCCQQPQRG